MSCFLCGREKKGSHHLGCPRIAYPDLTKAQAIKAGLLAAPAEVDEEPEVVEVLKENSMTTVPEASTQACEVKGCDNPKYSDSPRTKYCEEHRDPKNRKE